MAVPGPAGLLWPSLPRMPLSHASPPISLLSPRMHVHSPWIIIPGSDTPCVSAGSEGHRGLWSSRQTLPVDKAHRPGLARAAAFCVNSGCNPAAAPTPSYLLVDRMLLLRCCRGEIQGQNKQTRKINFTLGTGSFTERGLIGIAGARRGPGRLRGGCSQVSWRQTAQGKPPARCLCARAAPIFSPPLALPRTGWLPLCVFSPPPL